MGTNSHAYTPSDFAPIRFKEVLPRRQSSNGSRIIQELRHRSTTEASAGSEAAKRILFCTSVVAEAPGIALASVFTGAPFITGAPVAAYVF